jgi:hypothetical protein
VALNVGELGHDWGRDLQLPQSGHGRILAVNEGYGFRPLISVQGVKHIHAQGAMPDSTLLNGQQLMYITNQEDRAGWSHFIRQYFHTPLLWNQLKGRTHETLEEFIYEWRWFGNILEVVPTAQAELTLLAGGYDPVMGYWMQFAGTVPFYLLPDWWEERPEWERFSGL